VELDASGERTVTARVEVRTGVPAGNVFLSRAEVAPGPAHIRAREAVAG